MASDSIFSGLEVEPTGIGLHYGWSLEGVTPGDEAEAAGRAAA